MQPNWAEKISITADLSECVIEDFIARNKYESKFLLLVPTELMFDAVRIADKFMEMSYKTNKPITISVHTDTGLNSREWIILTMRSAQWSPGAN